MAKAYERAKGRNKDRFVQIPYRILNSEAWLALSPTARAVWIEIMFRFNGKNNGKISLSCREASQRCNISKNTASSAFAELLDKGFVQIEEDSAFTMKIKKARRWRVTHMPTEGKGPSGEWKNWGVLRPAIEKSQLKADGASFEALEC